MKKVFLIISAVFAAVIMLFAVSPVNAKTANVLPINVSQKTDIRIPPLDFGDNNDYDSGDSDWGSDWDDDDDWDSDWDDDNSWDDDDDWSNDYDNSYRNYSNSTYDSASGSNKSGISSALIFSTLTVFALVCGINIFILVFLRILLKKSKKSRAQNRSYNVSQSAGRNITLPDRTGEIINFIRQKDPNFSADEFLSYARNVYVNIQYAWSNRNLEPVRIYLHDNLYNQTQKQIDKKIANGVVNIINSINVDTAYLTAYRRDRELEYVTVYLKATLTDYEINEKTGQLLRGDPNARYQLRYTLKFTRNLNVKTFDNNHTVHYCPNCGAEIEMSSSGKCRYCGSTITTGRYSWVLSEYSSIRNDAVDQGIYIEDNK